MPAQFSLAIALCVVFLGCAAASDKPAIPEKSNAEAAADSREPITQVRQTLNLRPQQTFHAALGALQRRGVAISSAREEDGILETDWVQMKDTLCGGHRLQGAPLGCRARMSVKVEPLHVAASALNIRYVEFCSLNEEVPLTCPDSTAERLMLSVVEEIRNLDAKTFNPPVR